jgi:hypothetical protein
VKDNKDAWRERRCSIASSSSLGGILGSDFLGAELAANGEHLGQPFGCWRRPLRRTCRQ